MGLFSMQRILDFFDLQSNVEGPSPFPEKFTLGQNYPNPVSVKNAFSTTIQFTVSRPARASIYLYDVLGRRVRTLFQGKAAVGENRVQVSLKSLPAGIYFYQLNVSHKIARGRLILVH